jgi:hypothetical protein
VAFAVVPMVQVAAAERSLSAARPRQEETRKNGENNHFGDGLHVPAAMLPRAGGGIAFRWEDVNCEFARSHFTSKPS